MSFQNKSVKSLSKSRYTLFRQCSKALWLSICKPEEAVVDASTQARFEAGNYIGDLAMGYLGPYEEVTAHKPDGGLDLAEMIRRTQDAIARGVENIAEASFSWATAPWTSCTRRQADGPSMR